MLAERFPELKALEPEEQLELASELAKEALRSHDVPDLAEEAVRLMEERLDFFLENTETGTDWETLRTQRDA